MPVRERPPLELSYTIKSPNGRTFRWGAEGGRSENVPQRERFSTIMPGGFETLDVSLPRSPAVSYEDLTPLSTIRVLGAGGELAGEFRLEAAPRDSGDAMSISPSAVGWQAALEDNSNCSVVIVDRDLSSWVGPSSQRKQGIYDLGFDVIQDFSTDPDQVTGVPQLELHNDGRAGAGMVCEAWFDARPGNAVKSVYFDYLGRNLGAGYTGQLNSFSDDGGTGAVSGTDVVGGASPSGTQTETFATAQRFVAFALFQLAAIGTDGTRTLRCRRVSVWGDTGLDAHGSSPDDGILVSDAISYVVGRFAPVLGLEVSAGTFVVPHLSFTSPTTAVEMVRAINRFTDYEWAVWGGPTFHYHPRGARGRRWRTRVGPSRLAEVGPQVSRVWNGVVVLYQDVDGSTRSVGPPGSQAQSTDAALRDEDPENPANQAGLQRYATLDMGGVSTAAAATEVGRLLLAGYRELDHSGSAQLVGWVEDEGGRLFPSWAVRAGDTIRFTDASDPSDRRVIRTDYDHDSRTNSIDLDAPPEGLDALLERLQVSIVSLGL